MASLVSRLLGPMLLAILLLGWTGLGCGSRTNESFVPADRLSRDALDRALKAWREGKSAGTLESSDKGIPTIQVAESDWVAGKSLMAYEILEELPPEGSTRRFRVRLTFAGPAYPQEVVYYMFGIDPIWISRDKDYSQMQSM